MFPVNLFGTLNNVYRLTIVTQRNGNDLAHRSHTQPQSGGTYVATGFIPWNEGRPMNPTSPVGATPNTPRVNVFSTPKNVYRPHRHHPAQWKRHFTPVARVAA